MPNHDPRAQEDKVKRGGLIVRLRVTARPKRGAIGWAPLILGTTLAMPWSAT